MKKTVRIIFLLLALILVGCSGPAAVDTAPPAPVTGGTSASEAETADDATTSSGEEDKTEEDKTLEAAQGQSANDEPSPQEAAIEYGAAYYDRDDVAAYLHFYGELPSNYLTKREARERDWAPDDGSGWVVGGDRFGNREGRLPEAPGRKYFEADVAAGYTDQRGTERLIYSNDGLIFYTDDHYESFEPLYGSEE